MTSSHDESPPDTACAANQDRIWAHFQGAGSDIFQAAQPRLDFLLRQIARRARSATPCILNIGVGSGYLERTAQARGWRVAAVDPDAAAVERLTVDGISGRTGYIEQLPCTTGEFDFVVASEVLEHLADGQLQAGVREIHRVLRPGGWFLGTVPFQENLREQEVSCPCCGEIFHRWGHQQSFVLDSIGRLLEPGFQVQKLGRTAFVNFGDRSLPGKLKGLVRVLLARAGQAIAIPTIYWVARRT